MLRATVSGSFHRHMVGIYEAVGELRAQGVEVLSPSDPTVVDHIGEFLFVASDKLRSIKLVQDRHLEAIRASDFLLVVSPDGYTGASTSGEIMAAAVMGVPVFSTGRPIDITVGQYVKSVPSVETLVARFTKMTARAAEKHVLVDPERVIHDSVSSLEILGDVLLGRRGDRALDAELQMSRTSEILQKSLGLTKGR